MLTKQQRIDAVLLKRFPGSQRYRTHLSELLSQYSESGLAPPHMIAELETEEEAIMTCLWTS